MSWRYHGHASPDPSAPRAQKICDRCNFAWQGERLQWEMEWRGEALVRTGFLVCPICLDVPAQFKKSLVLPADPQPIPFPRPNQFEQQMNSVQLTQFDPPPTYPSINPPTQTVILGYWDDGVSVWS